MVTQAGERRSARIESLRALAALVVVGGHLYALTYGWELDSYRQRVALGLGPLGVSTFFALTGYLLFLPFARRDFAGGRGIDLSRYALNRALRILPLYYVVLVVVVVVNGLALATAGKFALLLENFDPQLVGSAVDGPMWSLVVELHFYLLLPLLAWGIARVARGSARTAVVVLLVLWAASFAFGQLHLAPRPVWYDSMPERFLFFVPGMLLALARLRIDRERPRWLDHPLARADLCLVAGLAIWLVVFTSRQGDLNALGSLASLLFVGAAVLPFARTGATERLLDLRALAAVGVASYSLYLWHVPVLAWLPEPSGATGAAFLTFAAYGLPACLIVAFVSFRLVESPPLRLRRRWFDGSPAQEPASAQTESHAEPAATVVRA